ncbi:MAG: Asp-tRNA(Asn)/Glu-tRNA(Gln) amidotransferase subunit GatC [Chloroflexi bacterium]|nr:Asp-tRNA(Asn)/Glu-tRNA(Gln) amidotransferase subunit GatC [Chloroflexota bacterium]MDA1145042.1 Asp-tRNA(Asn)/Glu-tRNA(Gln) amidotransferase subunit GatC [Chloroflexota bacterium]MQC82927.1 Asp-tRNA(Asn)/Glu-tRNA(Gln) amidotransferase subunit GatC [Chloroflexota bacterium]PKB56641.1 MAG: asparaginyl/glutamyl-tRNA amidotransferase subunit C [SAR202 cluster bacterium Casp-Chloro-G1]
MALSTDEVRHIARLARIALSDDELERMRDQLSSILDHFEVLSEIDTEGVPPTAQSFALTNVQRADVPGGTLPREEALEGAPRREDGYFRVRAVLD